ncbi:hypothetical protein [Methanobacterium formicicum]|jgi:hypothetical protein|uniref:hypothetical protein n=1 Tax=Methanobacterium formicicum TaxID=2162 RepID=UPI000A92BA78|nr:hypothetical protein [Methanobacterium formicicum]MDH2659974.1 hypothetical protein [Methanobacterium formicicum]
MPEPILILAMTDDSETGKIIQTLAHSITLSSQCLTGKIRGGKSYTAKIQR